MTHAKKSSAPSDHEGNSEDALRGRAARLDRRHTRRHYACAVDIAGTRELAFVAARRERDGRARRPSRSRLRSRAVHTVAGRRCDHESAGKIKGSGCKKIGNGHLRWAFGEAACLMLRCHEPAKRWLLDHEARVAGAIDRVREVWLLLIPVFVVAAIATTRLPATPPRPRRPAFSVR